MRKILLILLIPLCVTVGVCAQFAARVHVGKQPNGSCIVATGQTVLPGAIAFNGRPVDIALHPSGRFFAVLNESSVFLATRLGVLPGSSVQTAGHSSYRGCAWTPSGLYLYISLDLGTLQRFRLTGFRLVPDGQVSLSPSGSKGNAVPGGMAISRDGARLFVACANRRSVVEVDIGANRRVREIPVQNVPFEAKLSADESTLIVSNWAGRPPRRGEERADSAGTDVAVDGRGVTTSGTVSLIDLRTGGRKDLDVGLHPCAIAVRGGLAWVSNAGSDTISEIDVQQAVVTRTMSVRLSSNRLFGSMPNALAVSGDRLFACCGGDNAVCEIDLASGKARGYRPAGFFPVGIQLDRRGRYAYVVNTKGNGSIRDTSRLLPGNVHQFQGTVSVLNLDLNVVRMTGLTGFLNRWNRFPRPPIPRLAVYNGAISHVLYIIKENRTYDQVLGDMPEGNGSQRLCLFGQPITPNHHAIAREFALFDNAYTSGTNSAEGHQWAVEGLANDYIERFYADYTRTYPFDGGDPMAYATSGFVWDAAVRKGLSVRVYGEFCKAALAEIKPRPKTWLDAWNDRISGENRIRVRAHTTVAGLRKLIHPNVIGWPLLMSDQWRADRFIEDYQKLSKSDKVPNLMILTLPTDHTEGLNPGYPSPRSMVADNDLALGRVLEAVSSSPQWKDTCVFVMEDDSQAGLDHVDGHRTVCFVASPYVRRTYVDSTLYTQISIVRSIELMLGLPPMNRFDALATPFGACFTDTPNLRPYMTKPNTFPLDRMNRSLADLTGPSLRWARKSVALDWDDVDAADWKTLNRIIWFDARGNEPYGGSAEESAAHLAD